MGLMDVLRKLGIVQTTATAGTYHSAKDRPAALQDDGSWAAVDTAGSDTSLSSDSGDRGDSGDGGDGGSD